MWAPLDKVISFALTINSRRHEFQADAFSARIGFAAPLQSGLVKIHVENLSNLAPDSWYSAYHFSHPPLIERLCYMEECNAKRTEGKGGEGKKLR